MRTFIVGGTVLTPSRKLPGYTVVVEQGAIQAVLAARPQPGPADQVIDASGFYVAPGMIDIHVHGADGCDTMDATPEALHRMARYFAAHGVTSYLPTTMTASAPAISAAIEAAINFQPPADGAVHLGLHLEGPCLNSHHKGAQPEMHLRAPQPEEYRAWFASGRVRVVTVAPELEGSMEMIEAGTLAGVEFAVGHSDADFETVVQAADHGLRQATHVFNAMLGLHHRRPGTLGAVLTDDRIYAQLIADGVHVHPAMVKLVVRAKGTGRTILITDAMRATGLPDGVYDLGGQATYVNGGVARLEAGNLAGSTLTMDAALRNVMVFAGLSLTEALPMATAVPAEALHLTGRKGCIAAGADADIMLLDSELQVARTIVGGQTVYQRA